MELNQTKEFLPSKQNNGQNEETTMEQEIIFVNNSSDRGLTPKIYKEHK
jgi:hypothetical protein